MDKLEVVAQALMKVETLDGEQFEALYTGKLDADELEKQVRDKEDEIRRQNAAEAEESKRIREEEERKLEEELAKYDTDYMSDEASESSFVERPSEEHSSKDLERSSSEKEEKSSAEDKTPIEDRETVEIKFPESEETQDESDEKDGE